MASPQAENGYTKISNEIMEQLSMIRIPGEARQVLDTILRKTYGWSKKSDSISLSQFMEMTGLSKVAICKGIKKLIEMNLITKKGNAKSLFTKKGKDVATTYSFQKDYEQWQTLPKKGTTITNNTKEKEYPLFLATKFELFYEKYPKKAAKRDAEKAWSQLFNGTGNKYRFGNLDENLMARILTSVTNQSKSPEWQEEDGKFVPYPATWLRGHRWEDESQEVRERNEVVL